MSVFQRCAPMKNKSNKFKSIQFEVNGCMSNLSVKKHLVMQYMGAAQKKKKKMEPNSRSKIK